ncbi:acyltransferase [Microbacterium aureliae]
MGATVVTSSHRIGGPDQRAGAHEFAPVTISDGSWIGANVTILPGVTIEEGVVVAAGAVVTKDCRANTLYAGVPARAIRPLHTG